MIFETLNVGDKIRNIYIIENIDNFLLIDNQFFYSLYCKNSTLSLDSILDGLVFNAC